LTILGRAFSKDSKYGGRKYQTVVRASAREYFPKLLEGKNLFVEVHYFYTIRHLVDLDNLLKGILDGLKGIAYSDDNQVAKVVVQRYNVSPDYDMENPLPEWLELLSKSEKSEFVAVMLGHISCEF
jgi:hypothetical protein